MNEMLGHNLNIRVSASSISDYLSCSQRLFFRLYSPEDSVSTPDMLVGTIVHEAIDKFGTSVYQGIDFAEAKIKEAGLPLKYRNKALQSLSVYYNTFSNSVTDFDYVEYKFNLPIGDGVNLVGKIDRIVDGTIYDWKTSTRVPNSIDRDIQFIIYNYAFKRLFKKAPDAVYFASLITGEKVKFHENKEYTDLLFKDIIPKMVNTIKGEWYAKEGKFTGKCFSCTYRSICYSEDEDVLVHTTVD